MARNYRLALKVEERNNEARQEEQAGNLQRAIKLYEQNIREEYADEYAFERLMIIYRKQKQYKDELRVINLGIDLFEHSLKEHLKQTLSRHMDGKKLELLSNAILKKTGSKTQQAHFPDPIDKWMKRREIVEEKLDR
jgi:tetratricopeptide (TPR) repeat protein